MMKYFWYLTKNASRWLLVLILSMIGRISIEDSGIRLAYIGPSSPLLEVAVLEEEDMSMSFWKWELES